MRDGRAYLKVTLLKEYEEPIVKDDIGVDINMIVAGKSADDYVRVLTRLEDAHHFKSLAENLQKKYDKRWRENDRILSRIKSYHRKARSILEGFAKKVGRWVVDVAKFLHVSSIFLEDLNNLIKHVSKFPIEFRDKLYLMQYGRIQYWIEWECKKNGLKVVYVDPSYSSTKCPKCEGKMREVSHRYFSCKNYGYENDRDVIVIMNLYEGGFLSLSTPQMKDVNSNR